MYHTTIISVANWLAVSSEALRYFLRLDDGEETDILEQYIRTATNMFETIVGRSVVLKTIEVTFDSVSNRTYRLPNAPIIDIISVICDGETLDAVDYSLRDRVLVLKTLPSSSIVVQYRAGYLTAEDVPPAQAHVIMLYAADLYTHRVMDTAPVITERFASLAMPFRDVLM